MNTTDEWIAAVHGTIVIIVAVELRVETLVKRRFVFPADRLTETKLRFGRIAVPFFGAFIRGRTQNSLFSDASIVQADG